MDRSEEDMKFVGFFSIFQQSFKTIFSGKKIFTQISLTLILPLTIIFLSNFSISNHLFQLKNNSITYLFFILACFTLLTLLSLVSTAVIVFTVASIYTGREVVFRHIFKIIPNIWKKLLITFVFIYLSLIIYNIITFVFIYILIFIYSLVIAGSQPRFRSSIFGSIVLIIGLILYMFGLIYLTVVWQLSSVVTVLENVYGLKAMKKGKNLLNGKKKLGMAIAFVFYMFLLGLLIVYRLFVEEGKEFFKLGMIWRVIIGILCGILVMILVLLVIVIQTVLYLVCKSNHREVIDKLSLSTFLGAYVEETVVYRVPGEEIQLGRPQTLSQQV